MSDFSQCKNWPSYCGGNTVQLDYTVPQTDGPNTKRQTIATDYSITVAGIKIPIIGTTRNWSTSETIAYGTPSAVNGVHLYQEGVFWCLEPGTDTVKTYRVSEDCRITKSTLHYLDLRYGVCLYRKNIEKVVFDLTSHTTNLFKDPWSTTERGRVTLKSGSGKNWDSQCREEWHLIIDGVDRLLTTSYYDPIPEMRAFATGGSDDLFDPDYGDTADPDLELIIHTSPPTSSDVVPWDDELRYYGYYSYKGAVASANWQPDGAGADYYYPAWCRALQPDPIWQAAAARRCELWLDPELQSNYQYAPPIGVTVDPLPIGTFVRHPIVGDVWQFLVNKRDSTTHLETSPNVDALVQDSLSKNGVTPASGTMLYYPIGV